jgi:aspartyl-tRNA(Asn)/glutamyl-tRNA(Gln) amidotransferase subunit B
MYQSRVFLEVRILVSTGEKAFCSCYIGAKSGTCPVCRREPGAYPVINPLAARRAYILSHSLDCALAETATYERPKGSPSLPEQYSLSGGSVKIGMNGWMDIEFHRARSHFDQKFARGRRRKLPPERRDKNGLFAAGAPNIRLRTGADFELAWNQKYSDELGDASSTCILKGVRSKAVIRCNADIALARYRKTATLSSASQIVPFVRKAKQSDARQKDSDFGRKGTERNAGLTRKEIHGILPEQGIRSY